MHSNTHSDTPDRLGSLSAASQELAAEDLDRLADPALAEDLLAMRRLLDGLEGQWLRRLAAVDARGAAGADQGQDAPSTAAWLRTRRRLSVDAAHGNVRTARALFGGALPKTAAALCGGDISPAHAKLIADGTRELADHVKLEAEPVLLETASRVDPPRLRQAVTHLCRVVDPDAADRKAARCHERRRAVAVADLGGHGGGERAAGGRGGQHPAGRPEPLARPADATDSRTGGQRNADALAELARRSLEGGWLPKAGGVRPQLLVTVDLDSLLGRPGGVGGEAGWAGPLGAETCRRLACDGTVARVLVSRQPSGTGQPDPGACDEEVGASGDRAEHGLATGDPQDAAGRAAWLRTAAAKLPPALGGAPSQPLEVGRATRVVQPAQRSALAVRDGGCVFPDCDRPLAWCDAHHLRHWVNGGPTDLDNLALLCRAHHRAVHEGGWRLIRGPDGRFTATPPDPPTRRSHRHRQTTAA
jgi:hypothetical protein